jgi:hypothetical protein
MEKVFDIHIHYSFEIPLEKAVKMVLDGEIPDGKTQSAILRAAAMLGVLKL